MSEPTYRIRIERDEEYRDGEYGAYDAMIFRISDDHLMRREFARSEAEAMRLAFDRVRHLERVPTFITIYLSEDGELCDPPAPVEPQSLRA